jgi:hypothetical protein
MTYGSFSDVRRARLGCDRDARLGPRLQHGCERIAVGLASSIALPRRWRGADDASKDSSEVALFREAGLECNLGEQQV